MLSLILFLLFPLLTASSSSFTSPLIQSTCNSTTNYSLCISTLKSEPNSLKATNIEDLSKISITISLSYATNTSSYMLAPAPTMAGASALRTCAQRYGNAREALQWALDALGDENYDYAAVHLGAAAEYPGMCRALFQGLSYPAEVARRERELKGLCQLDLDLVSLLSN